jgi:hypothetical protein
VDQGKLNAYARHGHHLVKGWLVPGAAEAIILLSQEQRDHGLQGGVAEIGVHHGRLFILLYLLGSRNEPSVAIDIFKKQQLNVDRSGAGIVPVQGILPLSNETFAGMRMPTGS